MGLIWLLLAIFVYFNIVYCLALVKRDFSVVDIAWGLGFVVSFAVGVVASEIPVGAREVLLGSLTVVWAIRLSGYILYRSIKKGEEDYRYAEWRKEWGEKANRIAYVKVFLLQAGLLFVISQPIYLVHFYETNVVFPSFLDGLGVLLWLVGFLFEAVGDYQKNKFKSSPSNRGRVCQDGLWKYTRHPNYFGEALLWWGVFFTCLNEVPFYAIVWSPLILHFLLVKVSGVAMLEKQKEGDPEYEKYKKKTNAFIPFFPRPEYD